MTSGPRNVALPVVLALGLAVVGVSLLPLWNQRPPSSPGAVETVAAATDSAHPSGSRGGAAGPIPTPDADAPAPGGATPQRSGDELVRTGAPPIEQSSSDVAGVAPRRLAESADSRARSRSDRAGGSAGSVASRTAGGTSPAPGLPGKPAGTSRSEPEPLTVFVEQTPVERPGAPGGVAAEDAGTSPPDPDRPAGADAARESGAAPPAAREPVADTPPGQPVEQDPAPFPTARVRALTPSGEYVVGDAIPVVVRISAADDVGHVPFHLTFNPRVVRFEYGEEGYFLGSDGNQTAFFAAPTGSGSAVVVGLSRLGRVAGVGGDGDLCVLHFTATGAGSADLGFARAKVRDSANRIVPSHFEPASVLVRE